jgi:hypothetical protein
MESIIPAAAVTAAQYPVPAAAVVPEVLASQAVMAVGVSYLPAGDPIMEDPGEVIQASPELMASPAAAALED